MAGLHGKYVFNFRRNWPVVFQSGCTISRSHQQHKLTLAFQILTNTWNFFFFLILAILVGMKWYLTVFSPPPPGN